MFNLLNKIVGTSGAREEKYEVDIPVDQASPALVSEIMTEVKSYYNATEQRSDELKRSEQFQEMGGVDYSWLCVSKKAHTIPDAERHELERICERIRGCEATKLLSWFRSRVTDCSTGKEVLIAFKGTYIAYDVNSRMASFNTATMNIF